jgi:metal-sulfur cluster biosynthetic enzyme
MTLTKEEILEALRNVYDPEIPVDIVNLGLIYDVQVGEGVVRVKMTTTAPGCPVGNLIAAEARKAIGRLAEAQCVLPRHESMPEIEVELVYDPPWDEARVSEDGRRMLGWR